MTFHLCPYSKVSHSPNKLSLSAATHTHRVYIIASLPNHPPEALFGLQLCVGLAVKPFSPAPASLFSCSLHHFSLLSYTHFALKENPSTFLLSMPFIKLRFSLIQSI